MRKKMNKEEFLNVILETKIYNGYKYIPEEDKLTNGEYYVIFSELYDRFYKGSNFKHIGSDPLGEVHCLECIDCGTIVIENDTDELCLADWRCPICSPPKYHFRFKYFTRDDPGRDVVVKYYTLLNKENKRENRCRKIIKRIFLSKK